MEAKMGRQWLWKGYAEKQPSKNKVESPNCPSDTINKKNLIKFNDQGASKKNQHWIKANVPLNRKT